MHKPDKEKLLAYADAIGLLVVPILKTAEAKDILIECENGLSEVIETIRKKAEAL